MRQLQPETYRPFKLAYHQFFAHIAFYVCNLMLYWCGFSVIWKLDVALLVGLCISLIYQKKRLTDSDQSLIWFFSYMLCILLLSYLGTFGGIGMLKFPFDMIAVFPFSMVFLMWSGKSILIQQNQLNCYELDFIP